MLGLNTKAKSAAPPAPAVVESAPDPAPQARSGRLGALTDELAAIDARVATARQQIIEADARLAALPDSDDLDTKMRVDQDRESLRRIIRSAEQQLSDVGAKRQLLLSRLDAERRDQAEWTRERAAAQAVITRIQPRVDRIVPLVEQLDELIAAIRPLDHRAADRLHVTRNELMAPINQLEQVKQALAEAVKQLTIIGAE